MPVVLAAAAYGKHTGITVQQKSSSLPLAFNHPIGANGKSAPVQSFKVRSDLVELLHEVENENFEKNGHFHKSPSGIFLHVARRPRNHATVLRCP
jgi:hypothetical protein